MQSFYIPQRNHIFRVIFRIAGIPYLQIYATYITINIFIINIALFPQTNHVSMVQTKFYCYSVVTTYDTLNVISYLKHFLLTRYYFPKNNCSAH